MKKNSKSISSIILSILLILGVLFSTVFFLRSEYKKQMDEEYESMSNAMYAVQNLISFESDLQKSYENFDITEARLFTNVAEWYFEQRGVSVETLSDYADRMGDCDIYYFLNDGSSITSEDAKKFPLGKTQMRMLKTLGVLETDDNDYTATRVGDGWLCFRWNDSQALYSVDFERILETCSKKLCVIENATGKVLVSTDKKPCDFLNDSRIVYDDERDEHAADGIQAGYYDKDSFGKGVYFEKIRLLNKYSVFVYVPLSSVLKESLKNVLPAYGIMLLCFILIWCFALKIRKQGANIKSREKCLRISKRWYINLPVARRNFILLVMGIVLTLLISAYIPLLNAYNTHNEKISKNLGSMVSEMELNDEEWNKMEKIFRELVIDRVQTIADMMEIKGKEFNKEDLVKLTNHLGLESAVIYDKDGKAEISTEGYEGYTLSKNPDDDEFVLWNLLNQAETSMMDKFSSEDGFFAAVRRMDDTGIVYVTLSDASLRSMEAQTDVSAALLRVNTDSYAKMYISAEDTDKILWAKSSSDKVRSINNSISKSALLNGYNGVQNINGYTYYVNTVSDDEHILISAEQTGKFKESMKCIFISIIPVCLIVALMIFVFTCLFKGDEQWLKEKPEGKLRVRLFPTSENSDDEEKKLDEMLKKKCISVIKIIFGTLIVLYFADAIFADNSLSKYIFSHQWDRKPGIYSLTTILLTVSFAYIIIALMKKTVKILSNVKESRVATIGNLVVSILQFGIWAFVFIYSLYQ
ncbi:MAG: hypothetical protein K6G26_02580, partial [Lachnospiraceae bacterium]|nr:hypothetical protein [Lachnospiraceae bacterium]